ncbi:MAG: 6-carboxytetrahydropterin synthase QueD [Desulfonatronovibrionaceae bacterium]
MSEGKWFLQVEDEFGAAHQLRNYGGRCERLHGHNFRVNIQVSGGRLQARTGILIDFKELKAQLRSVLSGLDHRFLNQLSCFETVNPSSENIAAYIYRGLRSGLDGEGVRLDWVMVAEKDGSRAYYTEE